MKYTVTKSYVRVIGAIWMPMAGQAAYEYVLTPYDVNAATDDDGKITRESVSSWLDRNAGDFSRIDDFDASIELDGETINIPWQSEESELTYNDCTDRLEYDE